MQQSEFGFGRHKGHPPPHIRWGIRLDFARLAQIDTEWTAEPWGPEEFHRRFLGPTPADLIVAEVGPEVVGFAAYNLNPRTLKVIRVVVAKKFRRRGYGQRLMHHLLSKLRDRRRKLTMNVRGDRLDLQLWAKACGLRCIGINDGYYEDGTEAYHFVAVLDQPSTTT